MTGVGGEMCLSADGRQNGWANGVGLGVTCPGRLGWVSVILLCFCGSSVEGRDAGNRVQSERSHIVTLVTFEVHSVVLCAVC